MDTVNIYDAKTHLSYLVDKAASGEDAVAFADDRLTRVSRPHPHIQ